ncbi:tail fiber protein [Eikenella sp. Marseille-P7795]|uniref:tail fiber protein n=1 Tax=Eikenella sp. Marseille-P7795 TaxID=2866577 RepID=UPI001CE3F557|nr:tail fiber protein [Eikenella sp. Marseille-P7795]
MANIKNSKEWAEHVRQIEVGDRVIGGTDAPINICLSHLVGRTGYLKDKIDTVPSKTAAGLLKIDSAIDSDDEDTAASLKAVKIAYKKAEESAGKGLPVGAVIGFPRAITNPEGYLKADGSTFAQATYPDLHRVLGGNKLPNMTSSDVGMTSYFPIEAIPDGWIKFDDIASKVTQSTYPELYRLLVAQYGSIAAVPKAEDRFIRNASGSLAVGTQQGDAIRNITGTLDSGSNATTQLFDAIDGDGKGALFISRKQFKQWAWENGSGINDMPAAFSFDASRVVPTADENRPKAIAMVLCIKARDSLDDVVFWIKAYGTVTNAGALDASTLAADIQRKANRDEVAPKTHTHRSSEIIDLAQAVRNLFAHQFGDSGYLKLPNGLVLQWGYVAQKWAGEILIPITFPLTFASAFGVFTTAVTEGSTANNVGGDITLPIQNLTGTGFTAIMNTWGPATASHIKGFYWFAIGRV